jgi:heme exporter protein A
MRMLETSRGAASLVIDDVSKSFGSRVALSHVSLTVEVGERVALVGPNGAGKSTLLRVAALLTRPGRGRVRIGGLDAARSASQARRQIGYVAHRALLYDDLTGRQNLLFYARMYDVPDAGSRVDELLDWAGLAERGDDLVRGYSRGMQQRLTIARALIHNPGVLLLDEPLAALDPEGVTRVEGLLRELASAGCAVLMSTHDLERVTGSAGRMVVLVGGRLRADLLLDGLTTEDVAARYRSAIAAGTTDTWDEE